VTPAELQSALREVMAQALDEPALRTTPPQRLTGGASRETWSFDAVREDGTPIPCILRRDPEGAPRRAGMTTEAVLLRAAGAAGVRVPRVYAAGDGDALAAPYVIMERIEGETLGRRILREPSLAQARAQLTAQCAQAAARIHAIPVTAVPGLDAQDPVAQYRDVLDSSGEPHPVFELAFRWLEAHRPRPREPAVVHGDLRLGNLIVGPDGLRAVLDWELAHLGNPVEDLGWLCVRSWRFGAPGRVAGVGDAAELLAEYARAGGAAIEADELFWWEVMGTLRWGVICIVQAATHLTGAVRSVELAAIGRRVCEVEWDLLGLLEPVMRG
jgi:aminoglycoside phosphotransferase (APT) family kinase protein